MLNGRNGVRDVEDGPLGPANARFLKGREVETRFVDAGEILPPTEFKGDLTKVKIIVGRKGSGKTHILRLLEERGKKGRETIYCSLEGNPILDMADRFRDQRSLEESIDIWCYLWRVAVAAAVLSRFTVRNASSAAQEALQLANIDKADLVQRWRMLCFAELAPIDPLEALGKLVETQQWSGGVLSLRTILSLTDLEAELTQILHHHKPIHFLIDGLDEFASRDPRSWLEIQAALYKLVFLRDLGRAQSRSVHLTISLRKYVYSAARSIDAQKDREVGVYQLLWDIQTARKFMDRRLWKARKQLPGGASTTMDRPLATWLGVDTIVPPRRGRPEAIETYVLRHTRCTPRQIVTMVHAFSQWLSSEPGRQVDDDMVRELVATQSRSNAELCLETAAEELLSLLGNPTGIKRPAAFQQRSLVAFVADQIQKVVMACGREIADRETLRTAAQEHLADLITGGETPDIRDLAEDILWRSGVFAFPDRDSGGWTFTWSPRAQGMSSVPQYVRTIGFHPSMIDLCDLELSDAGPIF
jgi:hypothetical protein